MPDLDPTALPPELADPADIEALNSIARETGLSPAQMIRDAIHKAVLAHRVWDTPFFDEPFTSSLRGEGTVPALFETGAPSEGPDLEMYVGGNLYLAEAKYSGKRSRDQRPSLSHALTAAKELRLRDPEGWNAIRTLLLASRIPVKRLKPGTLQQARSKVSQNPELNALLEELNDASAALRRHLTTVMTETGTQPTLFEEEQVDEADEAVLVLFRSAAAAQEDGGS
ncbi:CopG family transcriptional regulator [Streptomyces cinereoruber]|uniref:ribbon-helix-helix domain-containing protein n=1 Tax=Streptomyces cinereoruber TaxID=67260 RepID=UPI003C2B7A61